MPPYLALFIWFILLLLLFYFDPAKDQKLSSGLWVPIIWMSLIASRLPSQWLGAGQQTVASAIEEGNMLDRSIWLCLILVAMGILMSRSFDWADFIARNLALAAYLSFALVSILWADSAFVSFKKWFRDLGSYFVVLIVLSDPHPFEAVRTVLRRVCYLLIPLSIILLKYFPKVGRVYDQWSGLAMYIGVATSKNMLGAICLLSGVYFCWDSLLRWPDRKDRRTKRILFVDFSFLFMTLYLLRLAHSATSGVCAVIGCLVIAAAHSRTGMRHPAFLKVSVPLVFCVSVILGFGFGLIGTIAELLGRDPTLTDRTHIWKVLLGMDTSPLFGTGYEGFWMGSRLEFVSQQLHQTINEAHNGYLEVYLNLGAIGVVLLLIFLIAAYKKICAKDLSSRNTIASLTFGLWTVAVFYNLTEAAFKHGLTWLGLLLGAIALPKLEEDPVVGAATVEPIEPVDELEVVGAFPEWHG